MLRVPSLKPSRLRGVASFVLVVDVRPKQSSIQLCATAPIPEPGQVAHGVKGHQPPSLAVWAAVITRPADNDHQRHAVTLKKRPRFSRRSSS